MFEELKEGLKQAISLEQQVAELEHEIASQNAFFDSFVDELCQILFEGENTETGRKITIDRIKTLAGYNGWLDRDNDEEY